MTYDTLFVLVINDRHYDPITELFERYEDAMSYFKDWLETEGRHFDDIEEPNEKDDGDLLFSAWYGGQENTVHIYRRSVNKCV